MLSAGAKETIRQCLINFNYVNTHTNSATKLSTVAMEEHNNSFSTDLFFSQAKSLASHKCCCLSILIDVSLNDDSLLNRTSHRLSPVSQSGFYLARIVTRT